MRSLTTWMVAAALAVSCGDGGSKLPEECLERELPTLELPPGAGPGDEPGREAVLSVEQRFDALNGDAAGDFQVYFFDFSTYEGQTAPIEMDGGNCWRIIGQPVIDTPPTPLAVTGVRIAGLPGGDAMVGDVTGAHASDVQAQVLGESDITLESSPVTTGDPTFPQVSATAPAAAPISGVTASREAIGAELLLEWEAGDATWVELELVTDDPLNPGSAATRNRVVCRVRDDGCQQVPAGSLDWLMLNHVEASLKLERHEIRRTAPETGTLATVDTIQSHLTSVDLAGGRISLEE